MSERVINDPTVAGWEFDPDTGYWMWVGASEIPDGGGLWNLEGNGSISRDSDVYITSSLNFKADISAGANNPNADIGINSGKLYLRAGFANGAQIELDPADGGSTSFRNNITAMGNVGIGGDPTNNNAKLWMHGPICVGKDGGNWSGFIKTEVDGSDTNLVIANAGGGTNNHIVFETNAGEALRIDGATGNPTWSNDSWVQESSAGRITMDRDAGPDRNRFMSTTSGFGAYQKLEFRAGDFDFRIGAAAPCLSLSATGDATFSGAVSSNTLVTNRPTNGFWLTANQGASSTTFHHNGGVDGKAFEINPLNGRMVVNGTLNSSRMLQDGSPVIDAKGLIETLSTLRTATQDETTLEGLRDSISNAIGGLIEKFEAMQSTATQEINDE